MYQELIKRINKECFGLSSYDGFSLREMVAEFCKKKSIYLNTSKWIYLIDTLWCDLDTCIRNDFDDIEEFETWVKDLVKYF